MKARSLVFTVLIGAVLAAELYVLIAGGGRGTVIVTGVIALELLLAAAFLSSTATRILRRYKQ